VAKFKYFGMIAATEYDIRDGIRAAFLSRTFTTDLIKHMFDRQCTCWFSSESFIPF
jgi:hypothetical protein